ncbi:hypothetical protein I3760_02G071000 [Carya illinoinensis]|nr:hypothetical protein I3760_02G071000 [Carya illinoinensis]
MRRDEVGFLCFPSSPYFLNPNDGPATLLTNHPLTAENYHSWARTVRHSLRIKKKLGFIDGTFLKPSSTYALLEPWLECNDMVVTWLQNTILFDELLNFEFIPSYSCGAMKSVLENQQREWMMKFLMGLNDSFDNIKAQIILLKPTPSLIKVYALVQ